jgi:hypothetical protein
MVEARPYRPSNGTEGECFMEQWCHCCVLDRAARDEACDPSEGCRILADAFAGLQPSQWIYGEDGKPRCTSFQFDEGQEYLPLDPNAVIRPLL